MAFLDSGSSSTLEDVLSQTASNQANTIGDIYAKKRRQSISQQAHLGRLGSGVSNYQAGDINAAEAGDLGDVYGGLASALGQVPLADYSTQQDAARKRQLAELLAKLSSPSALEEALGALGIAGNLAGQGAAIAAL